MLSSTDATQDGREQYLKSPRPRPFNRPDRNTTIELTDEREQHITVFHPGTLPDHLDTGGWGNP